MVTQLKEITVAHSPDADDAFMFYGLAQNKIDTHGLKIRRIEKDIQSLNAEALASTYEMTAISFACYPLITNRYYLTTCAASMGDKYGPVLIARQKFSQSDLSSATVAIPGKLTTAYLALRLFQPNLNVVEMPFDQITEAIVNGTVDAGLLIHEGQLTYLDLGLTKILDLGEWWSEKTKLPLPLGGNVIRKDLGDMIPSITKILKESIVYSLAHRNEAIAYAMGFARGMTAELAGEYIDMYVNDLTVDCGEIGKQAVQKLFDVAFEQGILEHQLTAEFAP